MIDMIVKAEEMEVRGIEEKINKKGEPYLLVNVDDLRGKRSELVDKDMDNLPYYKRGTVGTFHLQVSVGKYASVTVKKFEINK